jgi:hypothetical protein
MPTRGAPVGAGSAPAVLAYISHIQAGAEACEEIFDLLAAHYDIAITMRQAFHDNSGAIDAWI